MSYYRTLVGEPLFLVTRAASRKRTKSDFDVFLDLF